MDISLEIIGKLFPSWCFCEFRKKLEILSFVSGSWLELLWKLRLAPEAFDWLDLCLEFKGNERRNGMRNELIIKLIWLNQNGSHVTFVGRTFNVNPSPLRIALHDRQFGNLLIVKALH
ncbi:MAG: hypothetical protein ACTS5F_01875 [Candidatus Hodgkinia cicadicola]